MAGFVTARLDAAGGEWDLYMADARAHRTLSSSRAFGSHELAQTWVSAGQRLLLTGCRTAAGASTAALSIELVDAPRPAPARQSLVRTAPLSRSLAARLTALGFDFDESTYADHTELLVPSAGKLAALRRLGVRYRVTTPDLAAYDRRMLAADSARAAANASSGLPTGRDTYRYLSDYQSEMQDIVARHPGLARAVTIGHTYQGRPIQGVELSDGVDKTDDGKPVYFVMGIHHAREWPAGEVAMEFMHLLADEYGRTDDVDGPHITSLLQHERILIVPIINVDGFYASRGENAVHTATGEGAIPDAADESELYDSSEEPVVAGGFMAYRRKNCDAFVPSATALGDPTASLDAATLQNLPCYYNLGVDPNRNYGFDWGGPGESSSPEEQTYRGTGQWSEPETQAVWHYSQTHPVTALITLHTVAALVLRSPGLHTHGPAPDETLLKELGDKMAAKTGYKSEYGYQLYDTTGTTEDWNYGAVGTLGYTIELGDSQPGSGHFHGPYKNNVIDQWFGKKGTKTLGGMHDALLIAADYAENPATHVVLTGTGAPGAELEVSKQFATDSSDVCTVSDPGPLVATQGCTGSSGKVSTPDRLDYKTTVGPDGTFTWHVTQSTRPFVGYTFDATTRQAVPTGNQEQWTLTCSVDHIVVARRTVFAQRGDQLALGDVCAPQG